MTLPISPPSKPEPEVVRVLRSYRTAIDGKDEIMTAQLAQHWLRVESQLEAEIAWMAQEIADKMAAGDPVTEQLIMRSERYQRLQRQVQAEVAKYNQEAAAIISQTQETMIALGIDAAQSAIITQTSPFFAFNRINVGAVQNMVGMAGDGSPLLALLQNSYGDASAGILNAMIDGIAHGFGAAQIAQNMTGGMAMGLERALLIARTETMRAYREASLQQYRDSGVVDGFYRLVKKSTACLACLMMDGDEYELESQFSDHPRGKAELPGNLIVTSNPTTFETLWHDGDIVVIHTASGKFLSVTPNHPILTDMGWMAAKFIQPGHNVISSSGLDWTSGIVRPNKNHVPTLVENIPGTFNMLRLGSVPEAAKNLYSNREDGKVKVIYANRFLWDSFDTTIKQEIKQHLFGSGNAGLHSFNPVGSFDKKIVSLWNAALRILCGLNSGFSFCLAHSGKAQSSSIRTTPARYPVFPENTACRPSGYAELFSDGIFRNAGVIQSANSGNVLNGKSDPGRVIGGKFIGLNFVSFGFTPEQPLSLEQIRQGLFSSIPAGGSNLGTIAGNVILDSVVNVNISRFSGHVYSLQTKEEWYSSNGIISHNCQVLAKIQGVGKPKWEKGQEWFEKLPADEQRRLMGADKYDAWKRGEFKLKDLSKMEHSDVWGDSPRVATLDELTGKKKPASGVKVKKPEPVKFTDAKSIAEANDYARNVLGLKYADYKGADLRIANEWNKGLAESLQRMPELKKNIFGTGTTQGNYKAQYDYWLKKKSAEYARKHALKTPSNIYAYSMGNDPTGLGLQGIFFNNKMTPENVMNFLQADVLSKFHPEGTATIKAIFDHEIGHQIDDLLSVGKDTRITDLWINLLKSGDLQDQLSAYADKNKSEFIAEAWSEFTNNPNPRPVATQVGNIIMELYESRKNK